MSKKGDSTLQYNDALKFINDYNSKGYQGKDVVAFFNQALSLFTEASTRYEFLSAYGAFSLIISKNQRYMPAYLYRAYANTRINNFEAAIKDFNEVIELIPTFYQVYVDRGNAYLELERFDEAIKSFTWVIDHDPMNQTALILREKAYASKAEKNKFLMISQDIKTQQSTKNENISTKNNQTIRINEHMSITEVDSSHSRIKNEFKLIEVSNKTFSRRGGSKYDVLGEFLSKQDKPVVTLRFSEIEKILGFQLPNAAYMYRPWWANGGHAQCMSWMRVGWKVDKVALGEYVSFRKVI